MASSKYRKHLERQEWVVESVVIGVGQRLVGNSKSMISMTRRTDFVERKTRQTGGRELEKHETTPLVQYYYVLMALVF